MKKLLLTGVAFTALIAGPAMAAELRVKTPIYKKARVVAPAYSWTGLYVGAFAGYGWGRSDTILNPAGVTTFPGFEAFVDASVSATATTLNTHPTGFIGGGQLGYNFQINRLVLGIEADLWAGHISSSVIQQSKVAPVIGNPVPAAAHIAATTEQDLRSLSTVRGRAGFTPIDGLLVYATGGLAFGSIGSSTSTSDVVAQFAISPASGTASARRTGWTAGGGFETALAQHWSVKVEYLYYNLGNLTYALGPAFVSVAPNQQLGIVNTAVTTTDFRGNIVRAGLNYRFY